EIVTVEIRDVESVVDEALGPARRAQRLLEGAEARDAALAGGDDLAVDPRLLHRKLRRLGGQRSELRGPVVPLTRVQPRLAACDPAEETVPVVLDLVEPVGPLGCLVHERRELGGELRRKGRGRGTGKRLRILRRGAASRRADLLDRAVGRDALGTLVHDLGGGALLRGVVLVLEEEPLLLLPLERLRA